MSLPLDERSNPNLTGMRDVWCWALSWYVKPPPSAEKHAQQAALIEAIKAGLQDIEIVEALHERYCADSRWCLNLARTMFPREWSRLGVHATTAAAYGLRYIELMTNRAIDAREPLPRWVGEWAIW